MLLKSQTFNALPQYCSVYKPKNDTTYCLVSKENTITMTLAVD